MIGLFDPNLSAFHSCAGNMFHCTVRPWNYSSAMIALLFCSKIRFWVRDVEHQARSLRKKKKKVHFYRSMPPLTTRPLGHSKLSLVGKAPSRLYIRYTNTGRFVQPEFHCPMPARAGDYAMTAQRARHCFSHARDLSHLEEVGLKDAPADLVTRAERLR